MRRMLGRAALALFAAFAGAPMAAAQETVTGRLSDSSCAAAHLATAAAGGLSDRECIFACLHKLAKFVLIDQRNQIVPIVNQDAMGLPLYAGRPVRVTGERKGDAIFVTKVEAIPAHLHLGHVMTNWRDTPGARGFLPVAVDEARVALVHARLAQDATNLDDIKLHASHVLNALDPALEPKGPSAGYGVRKATVGAQQHLDFAAKADGATPAITTYAIQVSAALANVMQWLDEAVAAAKRARAATQTTEGAAAASELVAVMLRLTDRGLQPAQAHMSEILKAEGLLGAPR